MKWNCFTIKTKTEAEGHDHLHTGRDRRRGC